MLGIIINAAILCIIMYAFARHEADYSFPKVIIISFAVAVIGYVVAVLGAGVLPALAVMIGLTVFALHQFCYLRWGMATIISGVYFVVQIAIAYAMEMITS